MSQDLLNEDKQANIYLLSSKEKVEQIEFLYELLADLVVGRQ